MTFAPSERVRVAADVPTAEHRAYVLYWQIAARRTRWSFALEHAVAHARALAKPLVVLEALGTRHEWASDRLHRFPIDGMAENAKRYAAARVAHLAYVEPRPGEGRGLLETLAEHACLVVTDDALVSTLPELVDVAGRRLRERGVRLEIVDGNGLLPVHAADRAYTSAFHFRRHLQRTLLDHLGWFPAEDPLTEARKLPSLEGDARAHVDRVRERWPAPSPALLAGDRAALGELAIDHAVAPVEERGGERRARQVMHAFLDDRLARYADEHNHPDAHASSGLSPWLHWGFLSPHEVLHELAAREGWSPMRVVGRPATGQRAGWWRMSASAEAFLDELVTWRELGMNGAVHLPAYRTYEALPAWAQATLATHVVDQRPVLYSFDVLEAGETADEVWNAAQHELLTEGRIHNYLRMLWGKKVLEWTAHPREAAEVLIALNDRWAIDGRDPNSYSGIFWVLGRYDRPWFPERPIFGTVRPMSSAATRRKVRLKEYLARASGRGAALGAD